MAAYIYEGEDMAAVKKAARAFAKSLNCEAAAPDPCGECLSCRTFESGNHPDTFFVTPSKQSGIGVDDVREQIIMPMAVKPFKYRHKIFITESPLTPQAQNALLKTIEEPAPYGIFLFLAPSLHGFLPTVLSRCVVKKIRGGSTISHGNEAETLAREVFSAVQGADIAGAFALYKKIEPIAKDKDALQDFLDSLYILFGRNIAVADAVVHTKKILSQNANTQLAIELMLNKMR